MRRLAQIITFALLVNVNLAVLPSVSAQKSKQSTSTAKAPQRYAAAITSFDEFARKHMAMDKTVGLTIGFMKDDFVLVTGYGFADLENRVPTKSESAYRLASVTKPMTAIAIMQLVEKGKINLDAEVQTYVPYFPKKKWPVTVRQLLGHLGGISHYKNPAQELHIKDHKSTREAVAIFEGFDLIAEPGTRYSYSSYGYNLLGAVIEGASGMSYGDYMRQNVWQPLGMNDTRMDDPLDVIPNRVRGYQLISGKVANSEFVDISSRFAAGGTRSTVPDLLKFARGVMDGKLLSSENMNVATTSMSTRDGRLTDYAMGWETTPNNGRYLITHSGGQNETRTLLYIFPSRNMALAVGVNFESSNPGVYLERLFQLLTGAPLTLTVYSPDKTQAAIADALNSVFNYGLASFEKTHKPLAVNQDELKQAFAYFNQYVNPEVVKANQPGTVEKLRQGVHPAGSSAFTKVGSYIAQKLNEKNGAARMDAYASLGALEFFRDYIALTVTDTTIPKDFHLNVPLEQMATAMARDWSKTNTAHVRSLWLMPDVNLTALGKTLRQSFAGASAYPNLVDDFFSVTRQLILNGDRPRALEASKLGVELYPASPTPHLMQGIALIVNGQSAPAQESIKKAASINPQGGASAGGLNNIAYQLAGVGMVDEGISTLRVAIELYPKEANLHDSLGEFQLRKGDKVKALESYKKALEINPNFPNATAAREIVKKLSDEVANNRVQ